MKYLLILIITFLINGCNTNNNLKVDKKIIYVKPKPIIIKIEQKNKIKDSELTTKVFLH